MATPELPPPTWRELLAAQDGVLSRRQALRSGLSGDAYQWRIERELWQAPLPGVVVSHTGTLTFGERVWAAVLYGGDAAAVSGDALVKLLCERAPEPDVVDVAVPQHSHRQPHDFFRPHRCRMLRDLLHPVSAPPQVRIAPGILHSAAWAPSDRAAEWRVAAGVQRRLVTVAQLRDALAGLPGLPRGEAIRLVLDDVELGAHARTELDFLAFLRRHGLPLPDRLQFKVRANGLRYLDAWWEGRRVAVEVDGGHHREVATWDADTLRANAVVVASRANRVILLRVTAGNLRHEEWELARQFRAVLL